MFGKIISFLVFLCFLLTLPAMSEGGDGSTPARGSKEVSRAVESEGRAAIQDGDIGRARERASHDALRMAIERVLGVMIRSRTITKNSQLIRDEIYADSEGYALCDEILEEGSRDGIYTVRLRALVSLVPLRKKLVSMGLMRQWKVMVVISEAHGTGKNTVEPAAETAIVRRMVEAGFYTVDRKYSQKVRNSEIMEEVLKGDRRAARELGRRYGFDIMVYGNALSQPAGTQKIEEEGGKGPVFTLHVCRARVDARAVSVDTAETLGAVSALRSGMEATGELGGREALKNAGEAAADELIGKLIMIPASPARNVQVVISGFESVTRAQEFEEALARIQGVRLVARSDYFSGKDIVEVLVDSDCVQYLPRDLESSKVMKKFRLRVTSATKSKISGRIK